MIQMQLVPERLENEASKDACTKVTVMPYDVHIALLSGREAESPQSRHSAQGGYAPYSYMARFLTRVGTIVPPSSQNSL